MGDENDWKKLSAEEKCEHKVSFSIKLPDIY